MMARNFDCPTRCQRRLLHREVSLLEVIGTGLRTRLQRFQRIKPSVSNELRVYARRLELFPAFVHRIVALVEIPSASLWLLFPELLCDLHGVADPRCHSNFLRASVKVFFNSKSSRSISYIPLNLLELWSAPCCSLLAENSLTSLTVLLAICMQAWSMLVLS